MALSFGWQQVCGLLFYDSWKGTTWCRCQFRRLELGTRWRHNCMCLECFPASEPTSFTSTQWTWPEIFHLLHYTTVAKHKIWYLSFIGDWFIMSITRCSFSHLQVPWSFTYGFNLIQAGSCLNTHISPYLFMLAIGYYDNPLLPQVGLNLPFFPCPCFSAALESRPHSTSSA